MTSSTSEAGDLFLSLQTKRAGKVKGESQAVGHTGEIDIYGWSWGLSASSALGSSQTTARRSYQNLVIIKRVDAASTALMSVLATNDEVKEAKLSMRKAGEGQLDFFTITLSKARVTAINYECDKDGLVLEHIGFSFNKVQAEYVIQQASGQRGGSTTFQDEIVPA